MKSSFWTNRRVLVTGGAGFLGSVLIECIRKLNVEEIFSPRSKDFNLLSWPDVQRVYEQFNPDIVFHLAAVVGGIGANRDNPGSYFYENALMGMHMLEGARQYRVDKSLVVGTICAYPKFSPVPFKEDDIWNGYPEETNAPYGLAKKMLLVQAQAYRQQYGMNIIYPLPVNLYGPRDNFDPDSSHVIAALIKKMVDAKESGELKVTAWGTGQATREFLYVDDAAKGLVLAMEQYEKPDPINLGSGQEVSIKQLAELIRGIVGFTGEIVWDHSKPDGQPRRKLDTSRAQKEFGFIAGTPLIDGLEKTVRWYESKRVSTS